MSHTRVYGRASRVAVATVASALALVGCASFRPANTSLERFDPAHGYRPTDPNQHRVQGRVHTLLAFSGGGTRAAAFAFGVLEELRDTEVMVRGERKRLIDEVDTISGVSGGSFPAAYYGLFGDRIFDEFPERFLERNIQGMLVRQALKPRNLFRLIGRRVSRSELASQLYDEHVFEDATFADLREAHGPRIYINATDLSRGNRFTFAQNQFDLICSDLDALPVSTAVAASSAVPGLLSPITLENHAGTCDFEPPPLLAEALASRATDPRRYRSAVFLEEYLNAEERPYIHLVDGGISDNLGLRATLETAALVGGARNMRELFGMQQADHILLVVVNAETDPNPSIDLSQSSPGLAALMNAVSGAQIRRYNFETMLLASEAVKQMAADFGIPGKGHFVEVSFDEIVDQDERRYFKRMPTSFSLEKQEVDDLRAVGRRLLRESPAFQRLLSMLK